MAFYDRAWMTIASATSSTITLGSAVSGFQTFAAAGVADQAGVRYLAIDRTTWEFGFGTYTASGTTLSRNAASTSAGGTTAVTLSSNATVFLTVAARDLNGFASLLATTLQTFLGQISMPQLTLSSATQAAARAILSGQEFYQSGNTDTNGMALLLTVNRAGNRQASFADSAALAQNSTNPLLTFRIIGSAVSIQATATDGQTTLPLGIQLNGGATNVGGPLNVTGQMNCNAIFSGQTITGTGMQSNGPLGVAGGATITGNLSVSGGFRHPGSSPARFEGSFSASPPNASGPGIELGQGGSNSGSTSIQCKDYTANALVPLYIAATSLQPASDNSVPLGSSGNRWSTVYAGTGTINTSDGTQKTVRPGGVTDQERAWAQAITPLAYQFNDAIAEKGSDKARIHWGVIAQDVYAAGIAAGIADPMHYAFLCQDELTTTKTTQVTVQRQVTATVTIQQEQYEIQDGRAVLTMVPVTEVQPVFDEYPVVDAQGHAVTRLVSLGSDALPEVRDDEGNVITAAVAAVEEVRAPVMHQVPRLEDVTEDQETVVPMLDDQGKPVPRWGIRYTELLLFLLACGVQHG